MGTKSGAPSGNRVESGGRPTPECGEKQGIHRELYGFAGTILKVRRLITPSPRRVSEAV